MAVDQLIELISRSKNPTVVGLDPRPEYIPPALMDAALAQKGETLEAVSDAYFLFNKGLIDALCDIVPAVKLQSACYEMLGPDGMRCLRDSALYAREQGLFVIVDAKRGDIGSTAEAYSAAFLGKVRVGSAELEAFPADALTINPYLGSDNLAPFLEDCKAYDKMVFVLCKTSNRSSVEVQELPVAGRPLYRVIAEQCARAGDALMGTQGYSSVGVVIGATHPGHLQQLRRRYPELFFLVPGYGAQGGAAEDVAGAFDKYGRGAIVNNSRGILCAWQKDDPARWAEAARQKALEMRDALRGVISMV